MSEIKPALTPEEWAALFALRGPQNMHVWERYPSRPHATAALALCRQSFGFTSADVEHLRAVAAAIDRAVTAADLLIELQALDPAPLLSVTDRIAALLPPRGSG